MTIHRLARFIGRSIALAFCVLFAPTTFAADATTKSPSTQPATKPAPKPPGVIVVHIPASSGTYIGSPSLAVLPNGSYLATHDHFGPKSNEHVRATSRVYRSDDRGQTWQRIAAISGAFWSTLFVHQGDAYLLGTTAHHGDAVIRRSRDGGKTWSDPTTPATGLLMSGQYHCAPVPVVLHNGRLWRAIEDAAGGKEWGKRYRAMMLSAPVDADLLKSSSWTKSNYIERDAAWLGGKFNAWLEGNAVVTPEGKIANILRVDLRPEGQTAAVVRVTDDGYTASFDAEKDFIRLPGGATKFTIRKDEKSGLYWSLVNDVLEQYAGPNASGIRNTVALVSSKDLREWTVKSYLIHHPDTAVHGFQYIDWLFDGEDLIALCRTAFDDEEGGAHNFHDANYLTFHRIERFRERTMADSVPIATPKKMTLDSAEVTVQGYGFSEGKLANDANAFGNRPYVWANVPDRLAGCTITQTSGGVRSNFRVKAKKAAPVYIAAVVEPASEKKPPLPGWERTGETFNYTDKGNTTMTVFRRMLSEGEEIVIPQLGWAGTLVLLPWK